MRRLLVLLITTVLVVGIAGVAVGERDRENGSAGAKPERTAKENGLKRPGHGKLGHKRFGHGHHLFLGRMMLGGLATRLGVAPDALFKAVRAVGLAEWKAHLAAAGVSEDEFRALKACGHRKHRMRRNHRMHRKHRMRVRGGATCDRAAAKATRDKLKAAKPDLAAAKQRIIDGLASRLGKTPDEVSTAIRAQLEEHLGKAVAMSFVTEKGRDLALGCFDKPAECDLKALRAEFRFPGHHGPKPAGARHHRR